MIDRQKRILELIEDHEKTLWNLKNAIKNDDLPDVEVQVRPKPHNRIKLIKETLNFTKDFLALKSVLFGIRTGLIQSIQNNEIELRYPNVEFVRKYLEHINSEIFRMGFSFRFTSRKKYTYVDPDYISFYDHMAKSAHYRLIHERHPQITLGFERDADLWDMWLQGTWFRTVRESIAEIISPSNGDLLLDVGCGSISPIFFSELIGPNGLYMGVDRSSRLLTIAQRRILSKKIDWAMVKNVSICDRIKITRKYDYVIFCLTPKFLPNIQVALKNIISALRRGGRIIIFTEFFSDINPELREIFTFYNSLIPSFKRFPSLKDILEKLNTTGKRYDYELHHDLFLEITTR